MNNSVYILEDRAIIYINGLDARDFLQNLISNDINKVSNNSSCFASLLTPQGKFLYEFIVVKHKKGFFIDCEKNQSNEILKLLNVYKIRSKVEILDLSNEFVVASFGYKKYLSIEGSKDILGFTFKYREDPVILDPRNKNLGARIIINLEKLYLSLKKLDLKNDKIEKYYIQSHKLGIVPKNLNQLQNKLFGIECNFEELNGIDFKKGCYIGQENTARMNLKDKISRRLFKIETEDTLTLDENIFYEKQIVGKVVSETPAFGIFKMEKFKNYADNILITSSDKKLKLIRQIWLNI